MRLQKETDELLSHAGSLASSRKDAEDGDGGIAADMLRMRLLRLLKGFDAIMQRADLLYEALSADLSKNAASIQLSLQLLLQIKAVATKEKEKLKPLEASLAVSADAGAAEKKAKQTVLVSKLKNALKPSHEKPPHDSASM
ncbi:MAG: hypothetical protein IK078_00700 [Lachnospiraceae bacterium]|nr:hypothetical protein [Lachnospiraceae bacterium]